MESQVHGTVSISQVGGHRVLVQARWPVWATTSISLTWRERALIAVSQSLEYGYIAVVCHVYHHHHSRMVSMPFPALPLARHHQASERRKVQVQKVIEKSHSALSASLSFSSLALCCIRPHLTTRGSSILHRECAVYMHTIFNINLRSSILAMLSYSIFEDLLKEGRPCLSSERERRTATIEYGQWEGRE